MELRTLASTNETFYSEPSCVEDDLYRRLSAEQSDYTYPCLQRPIDPNSNNASQPVITSQLEWLPDSSALLTVSSDRGIRTYIPPQTLLDQPVDQLLAYTRSFLPSITTTCIHPQSSLYTGIVPIAISGMEVPLKLYNVIPDEKGRLRPLRVFNNSHPQTEKYYKTSCLTFLNDKTILSGGSRRIQMFDIERSDPIGELDRVSGIVSAMTPTNSEFVTDGWWCGSWNGSVSLYSNNGEQISQTKLPHGVFQILESDNDKYIYVIPRHDDHIQVLDVRMGLSPVCSLDQFKSSAQRITATVLPNGQGLLTGTTRGTINHYYDSEVGINALRSIDTPCFPVPHVSAHSQEPGIVAYSVGDRSTHKPHVTIALLTPDETI